MEDQPLIDVKGLSRTFCFGEVTLPVLKGVDLQIHKGEFVAIMGASGSGKTTLMNLLGGLDRPTGGTYRLAGREIDLLPTEQLAETRSRLIGFVFQSFNLLSRTSALDNVLLPTVYSARALPRNLAQRRAGELLSMVGLGSRLKHVPAQLSGGEQQRVAIARALINHPQLLLADEPTGNLDSKTGRDTLALFQRLNREYGLTILLVTHDAYVARCADRVLHVADGEVINDSVNLEREDLLAGTEGELPALGPRPNQVRRFAGLRRTGTLAAIAASALRRNLMRTALTMLGIIIGVAAVITIVEISGGASLAVQRTVGNMGVGNLIVKPSRVNLGGISQGRADTLIPEDAAALVKGIDSAIAAAPIIHRQAFVISGNRSAFVDQVIGTTPEFFEVRDWLPMAHGNPFSEIDSRTAGLVCVIGQTLAEELFGDEYPIGKEIRVQNTPLRVIGVLRTKGSNLLGHDLDDLLVAPIPTVKFRLQGNASRGPVHVADKLRTYTNYDKEGGRRRNDLTYILVKTPGIEALESTSKAVRDLLRERHKLSGKPDDFVINDNTQLSSAFERTVELLSNLGLSVAAVSLLVGGIGIMNIMLVSVTERTREIGIRMAVGANRANIRNQFLFESTMLSLIGGGIGIVFGRSASEFTSMILGWPLALSPLAATVAVILSATVGVFFGFYPAWRASRLNPIQALRFE